MKSLTVRLVVSHLLLAVIALGGAGMLLEALLAPLLTRYDAAELQDKLHSEARAVALAALLRQVTDPADLTREVQASLPSATVERIDLLPQWRLMTGIAEYQYGVAGGGSLSQMPPAVRNGIYQFQTGVYQVFGEPRIRIIVHQEAGKPEAYYRLTWNEDQGPRLAAMRRSLIGAFLLALAVAGVAALWLGRTMSRPLNRMAAAAGRAHGGRGGSSGRSGTGRAGAG